MVDMNKEYILYDFNGMWDVYDVDAQKPLEADYDTRVVFDLMMKKMIKEDERNIMERRQKEIEEANKQEYERMWGVSF